ncbi:hypothetical protein [Nocardioides sp.]|uniref:hypothetical protein n=1 Tax=Nocardioides sp. TaxID=35761 RepID=UPI002736D4D0|nr:hypothetical protein [Nocardioides sp.]MDP3890679.1 hypothetical protein [Nocardioides sp.]
MARRSIFLHLGPPAPGVTLLDQTLRRHELLLRTQGIRLPATTAAETHHAALEIRRAHREAGLRRRDVEGTWARICRRAYRHRGTSVMVAPDLAAADPDQISLLLDGLAGLRVHLILTTGPRLADLLPRWEHRVPAERLHLADPAHDPEAAAARLGQLVGFSLSGPPEISPVSAGATHPRRRSAL